MVGRIAVLALMISATSLPAGAGTPIERDVTCPIDGSIFKAVGTRSCTYFGYTMALRRRSSCDFVTVLPTCKSNGFPIYRRFSSAELALLVKHVETMDYRRLKLRSRFMTAWMVETWLEGQGKGDMKPRAKFALLIGGLARHPHPGIRDPGYRKLFLAEVKSAIRAYGKDDRPFLETLTAFVEIHDGQKDAAAARLRRVGRTAAGSPALKTYIDAVAACLADAKAPTCSPDMAIPRK